MKNDFDLSKIAVKELPKKVIKANFEGTEKEYEIRALNDGEKMTLDSLLYTSRNVYRTRDLYVFLLAAGLDIEQAVAAFLFENVNAEAVRVGDEIFNFTKGFEDAKAAEAEKAEKNSKKGADQP